MKCIKLALMATVAASTAFAGDFIQWTDTSLTGLYGTDFKVDPEDQTTLTIEHANGFKWGDFFWFNDFIYYNGDNAGLNEKWSYYGEIAPRFSLGKMLNKDLSVAFINDWLIATCYEYGEYLGEDFGLQNELVGIGVDLDVPGFDYLQLNVYQRFNLKGGEGESIQVTPVWKMSWPMGKSQFVFDGFIDWVVNDDGLYSKNLHVCPQLKVDIGAFMGMDKNKLMAGAELDYWTNKYGLENGAPTGFGGNWDSDQFAYSGIVKYHF